MLNAVPHYSLRSAICPPWASPHSAGGGREATRLGRPLPGAPGTHRVQGRPGRVRAMDRVVAAPECRAASCARAHSDARPGHEGGARLAGGDGRKSE
eukprot:scaffold5808_cov128-Isochrysis_galbana.AAC.9